LSEIGQFPSSKRRGYEGNSFINNYYLVIITYEMSL